MKKNQVKDMSVMQKKSDNIVLFYPQVSELAKKYVRVGANTNFSSTRPSAKEIKQ